MDPDFRRQVGANVVAGLIVATVLGAIGLLYSVLNDLSLYEIAIYVVLPASLVGSTVSLVMILRGASQIVIMLARKIDETNMRLKSAEDRLGAQIARNVYAEVIAEAEAGGWKVTIGERGALHFSHPRYGTADTGGEEMDPDRLRLLLSLGRGGPVESPSDG